jgi:hypothetical protein
MIVIEDMNMPDVCDDCEFCINKDERGEFGECILQKQSVNRVRFIEYQRDSDCPLSETNEPIKRQQYTDEEYLLQQLFPIGTLVIYNKSLFEKLEKIYVLKRLETKGLYVVKERKRINDKTNERFNNK